MMGHAFPGVISHTAAVTAPALTVMAIILFMGKISGAHLNPAVSIAFALRRDFPWRRVPAYIVVQLIGATLAALILHAIINVSASYGSNYPAKGYSAGAAFWMELILTTGLVSVILGTASGAQNVGVIGAFGVGAYIALAGLWGSPISGASMNPARTFGPDLASTTFTSYWVYIAGPIAGAVIAVGIAFVLRGRGGATSPPPGPPKVTCSPRSTSPASPEEPDMSATGHEPRRHRAGDQHPPALRPLRSERGVQARAQLRAARRAEPDAARVARAL